MAYGSSAFGSESLGGSSNQVLVNVVTFFLDSKLILESVTKTYTLDVILVVRRDFTFEVESRIVLRPLKTQSIDVVLRKGFTKSFSIGVLIKRVDNLKTVSIDAKLVIRSEKTFTLDSLKQKSFSKTISLTSRIYAKKNWMRPWRYRKLKILSGVSTDELNYQIKLKVFFGSGTDTASTVYCNNRCNSDFSDLRFTKSDGTTLLNYWIQEFIDSDYCIVWVKIDTLRAGENSTNIYMYYGNPTASDIGNITNTMIFGDNFEGTLNNFTTTSNVSIESNRLKITTPGTGTGTFFGIKSNTTFKNSIIGNFALELCGIDYTNGSIEDTIFFGLCDNAVAVSASLVDVVNNKAGYVQEENNPARNHSYETANGTSVTEHNVTQIDWTGKRYLSSSWLGNSSEFFVDDISQINVTSGITDTSNLSVFMSIENDPQSFFPEEILVDSIFVRKFIPGIPNMGNWGDEEIVPVVHTTISRSHRVGMKIING